MSIPMACVAAQGQRYNTEQRQIWKHKHGMSRSVIEAVVVIRTIFNDEIQVQCQQLVKRRLMYIERAKDSPNRGRHVLTALGHAVLERDQAHLS